MIQIENKAAAYIRSKFVQFWLLRYPRPMWCVHDKSRGFIGHELQWLISMFSIKDVSSTSKNPQYNSIRKRMHQTVVNILSTELYSNPPQNMTQDRDIIDSSLVTVMDATRMTISTTLGSNPGALSFRRVPPPNTSLISDWQAIHKHRKNYVNDNLRCANLKRRQYDNSQGQNFLRKVHNPTNLGATTTGPYTIERFIVNGNITIEICRGITKPINIRQVNPFCWIISTYPSEEKSPI